MNSAKLLLVYLYYYLEMGSFNLGGVSAAVGKLIQQVEEANGIPSAPCPGNPEKGGDGSGGKDTEEIIGLLKTCRKILDTRVSDLREKSLFKDYFQRGDLVYDTRVEEHGVVLGEKPRMEALACQGTIMTESRAGESTRTYVVLTITTREDGTKDTRIRYSNRNNLRKISEPDSNPMTDLEKYCSRQCISACGPECVLYKYKTIPDEK